MADQRRDEERVAWYALGILEGEEKAAVERLLARSPEARALLETAREQSELLPGVDLERALDDVHPRLLVEYADAPENLDFETRRWVEETLETSEASREALACLRRVQAAGLDADPGEDRAAEPLWRRAWDALSGSLLAPMPALAYLLVAGVLVGWVVTRSPSGPAHTPLTVARIVEVQGEGALRDPGSGPARPPLVLGEPTLLRLRTALRAEDVSKPGLSFEVELSGAERLIWRETRTPADLQEMDGALVLQVVVDPEALEPGVPLELRLVARLPGDLLDGAVLFRRSLQRER